MNDEEPTIVRPVDNVSRNGDWEPVVGEETLGFLTHVAPEGSQEYFKTSAVSILRKGVSPSRDEHRQETGLVVGYIQSGKTMSFEATVALARDNGYQIIIVIAGISNLLLDQSTERMRRDFKIGDSRGARNWKLFPNPEDNDYTVRAIQDILEDWTDEDTPIEDRSTVLITALKHHSRIANLTKLLKKIDMDGVPVLIIDDEADQVSLNAEVSQDDESTTYQRLMEMRSAIPLHSYLQYTATPQAPLLVSIVDSLSPNFVEVLNPGDAYVGGRDFFIQNRGLVKTIPDDDVPTVDNPLSAPPDSLLDALRVFLVGIAAGMITDESRGNRAMLVHPSHRTAQHQEYYSWVRNIFDDWKGVFSLDDDDPDKQELVDEFRIAYSDLERTVKDGLPPFEDILARLPSGFRRTRVMEVNSRQGSTPTVAWGDWYGWILIGGQAMDRGFTVEGLTVTYMPRGIGVGNADTIQQRARFFGYKRKYLGYCRVYLEQGTYDAFQLYVEHEEDMRSQLQKIRDSGNSLNDWKRSFVLDQALRPCRDSVIKFDYVRGGFSDQWVIPGLVWASDDALSGNRQVVDRFVNNVDFMNDEGHKDRTDVQRHQMAGELSLQDVMTKLLIPLRLTGSSDTQRNLGLLLQLSRALEDEPNEFCVVYKMSSGIHRVRDISKSGKISQLFQGEYPVTPLEKRGSVYPGDRFIKKNDLVSIQIHTLDLRRNKEVVQQTVPVVAVWVPARMRVGWIQQEQPGQ